MNQKIGIVQVDGDIPNIALMQICQYHLQLGDRVEWWKGELWNHEYDIIYASKLFDFSKMPNLTENAIIGGTGINWTNKLPIEIQQCKPSYNLYLENWKSYNFKSTKKRPFIDPCRYHIGFSMKGCRFACKFCVVPQKEGRPWHNSNIDELLINPNGGNRLMLLDNDFFGSPAWKVDILRMIELDLRVCFVQGLNIRIITQEQAELLSQVNYQNSRFHEKYLTFAWDKFKDKKLIEKGIRICNEAGIPSKKMQFFVLIGYDTTPDQDYERVMTLAEMGCMPYVMPYNKSDKYQKNFARWVNHRAVFKTCKWEEYKKTNAPVGLFTDLDMINQ